MGPVIGIDLGTTNSVVASVSSGAPGVIPNRRGENKTPSVVAFPPDRTVVVGAEAQHQQVANHEHTVSSSKRLIGEDHLYNIRGDSYSAEDIAALILRELKVDAEAFLGCEVHDAVVTVPSHFSHHQRQATLRAGEAAGLRVHHVLNEPTAAAIAFAASAPTSSYILVYDLGGGTFDVTCLHNNGGKFSIAATLGDGTLGGIDFDTALFEHVASRLPADVDVRGDPQLECLLKQRCEKAKLELSVSTEAEIVLPFVGSTGETDHVSLSITRDEFEDLTAPLVERTLDLTQRALSQAGWDGSDVESLVLSGGSSRMPVVRRRVSRLLGGLSGSQSIDPQEIVAQGAALYASYIAQGKKAMDLEEVIGYEIGIEADGGTHIPLVPRNAALPARGCRRFTTVSDGQSSVEVAIVQRADPPEESGQTVGRFRLDGIRNAPAGVPRIEVSVVVDEQGMARVEAKDIDTGSLGGIVVTALDTPGEMLEGKSDGKTEIEELQDELIALLSETSDPFWTDFWVLAKETSNINSSNINSKEDVKQALLIAIEELREAVYAQGPLRDT